MKIETGLNPKYTKIAFWTAVAIAVIILVVWLWKKFKKDPDDNSHDKIVDNISKTNLTHELAQYELFANSLEVSFEDKSLFGGGLAGVNEKGIYSVMEEMKTDDDVKQLIKAFDKRRMRKQFDFFSDDFTLEQAMTYFLSASEVDKVNKILETNNVKFKFK